MARKYGIVAASDVRVAAERGANFRTGNVNMPRKPNRPVLSPSPGMVRPGTGINLAKVAGAIGQAGQRVSQQRQASAEQDRRAEGAARAQHPAQRSQGAVASRTGGNPIGALRDHPAVQSAEAIYTAPRGMGAKVPASRAAKFTQGRGL